MNFEQSCQAIVLGITFEKQFIVSDKFGGIIDSVFNSDSKIFNRNFFPKIVTEFDQRILLNDETGDKLIINLSNIILEYSYKSENRQEEFEVLYGEYKKFILKGILFSNNIKSIARIGCVLKYVIRDEKFVSAVEALVSNKLVSDVDELRVRLIKKIPMLEGLALKGVDDYNNILIDVVKEKTAGSVCVFVDYQKYYVPFTDKLAEKDITSLVRDAKKNSYSFLNKFMQ